MLVAFSLTPLGVQTAVADYIADAVRVIRDSGLPNRSDSMYTMIEGEWDEVMDVIKHATEAVAAKAPRVQLIVKADIWPDMPNPLDGKIALLEQHIAEATQD
ncbi:MTH1187 family thiamine-binding protein [Streptomyces sp. NPDC048483]|uniref:MTH1187 family thiamine-binding protein n=1 Tax=Streptomyces sp. NPDC048483 TaxID=3154927 RepID=UPI00341E5CDA